MAMRHRLGVLAVALLLVSLCAAALSDEAREYCKGKGSICAASEELDRACNEKSGKEYYECTCESGAMAADQACADCENSLGGFGSGPGAYVSSICKEEGYTIAALPSSISSSQSARNKTYDIPTYTQQSTTSTTSKTTSATTTPNYLDPYTTKIYGGTPVTLPAMATRTDDASAASNTKNPPLVVGLCLGFLAYVLF